MKEGKKLKIKGFGKCTKLKLTLKMFHYLESTSAVETSLTHEAVFADTLPLNIS